MIFAFLVPAIVAHAEPATTATPLLRFVEEAWNKGDYAMIPEVIAADGSWHYAGHDFSGVQAATAVVKRWRAGFPDFHFSIDDTVVQGNKIAARLRFTGTQQGTFWGQPATGKPISVTQTMICRVEAAKLKECWEDWDELGMRRQLGLIPTPSAAK